MPYPRDAFGLVRSLTSSLARGLSGLYSRVHREGHIITKDLVDLLCPLREDIVVESTELRVRPLASSTKA